MTVRHLPPTSTPDAVAAVIAEDGCAVIDDLASADLLDRLDAEMAGYVDAHAVRRRRVRRAAHPPDRRAGGPLGGGARARARRAGARHVRPRARSRAAVPAAPHPADPDRARRRRADDPPRPMGVRLLHVPHRLPGAVQHDLGRDRLHRGQRRDPRRARQPPRRRQAPARRRRHRAGRDGRGSVLLYVGSLYHGGGANTPTPTASASTSPTASAGCARRRTST